MIDITTHCTHVHLQASGQFWTSDGCSGLQQFKHSENATGWMIHDKPLLSATFLSILLKQGAIPPSFQHMLSLSKKSRNSSYQIRSRKECLKPPTPTTTRDGRYAQGEGMEGK